MQKFDAFLVVELMGPWCHCNVVGYLSNVVWSPQTNLRPEFFKGNKNIYLYIIPFPHIDMAQEVEILPLVKQEIAYYT